MFKSKQFHRIFQTLQKSKLIRILELEDYLILILKLIKSLIKSEFKIIRKKKLQFNITLFIFKIKLFNEEK